MNWPDELEHVREVQIETRRAADAPARRTTIWSVVEHGEVYVRSLRGGAGRWYREVVANPSAVLHVGDESVEVDAVAAADAKSIDRANAGYRRKYADSPYLGAMTADEILDTTLRLELR
jgi:hypothetical protein